MPQCEGNTSNGIRCRNSTTNKYCYQHQFQALHDNSLERTTLTEELNKVCEEAKKKEDAITDDDMLVIQKIKNNCLAEATKNKRSYEHPYNYSNLLPKKILDYFRNEGLTVQERKGRCTGCGSQMNYGCTCWDNVPWTPDCTVFEWDM